MLLFTGIGLHDTGINGKTLTADQTLVHAARQNLFKDKTERFRFAEPAMPVLREGGVVRHLVGNA